VPATMDGGGVLYETTDPRRVAALMHAVVSSPAVEDEIVARQDAALARLLALDFNGMVLRFVDRVLSSPRKPMPPIEPDFWRQFKQTDELEEIRMTRPSAFRALPLHPDAAQLADLGSRK